MPFGKHFLLGAATAAHQVEGNNIHSDCWAQEHMVHTTYLEPSLDAVDHYNRYEEDIKLLADAGLNTYRFSIEWARIEPEQGRYDDAEIEHYRKVIQCCKDNRVVPFVCMHHFSSPKWLIEAGGWEAESTVEYFRSYCTYVMERLGSELTYVCTINEANMGMQMAAQIKRLMAQAAANAQSGAANGVQVGVNTNAFTNMDAIMQETAQVFGFDDPAKVQTFLAPRTPQGDGIVIRAHEEARDAMKALCPHLKVGITLSLHDIQAAEGGEGRAAKKWDDEFLHYLPHIGHDDFIGVQNYTREIMGADGVIPVPAGTEMTDANYEFYPEALGHVIRRVAEEYKGDIIVTENGVGTPDDTRRIEFIRRALIGVESCMEEGIPVKGYLHWTLLDNFEWSKAYSIQFGLIAVDRATQTRHPKPSLDYLGSQRG